MARIALNCAYLCEDCRQIGENSGACEGCGSRSLLNLARVLERPARPETGELTRGRIELEHSLRGIERATRRQAACERVKRMFGG